MEGFAKVVLVLTVFLGALSMDVKGGRILKGNEEIYQPQAFGRFPGKLPSPSFGLSSMSTSVFITFPGPILSSGPFPLCHGVLCALPRPITQLDPTGVGASCLKHMLVPVDQWADLEVVSIYSGTVPVELVDVVVLIEILAEMTMADVTIHTEMIIRSGRHMQLRQ
ncbi:hypothetical protein Pfo_002129 [Paulownia fortunei]|nr:hypothetical protein Pfo_002129 [Paulownia fortunei]